ncbi:hypothetical protein AVEN_150180-1 [Araneus ventricosus]|uniref:Uncharacterized protein n=1 Tax=Araneus ventricosus TaxID=182803 RepID=A0A4Y2J8R8_ARAVE|nr:hypothetical protein AVEN_150180-1 [Araneus ventricosus]
MVLRVRPTGEHGLPDGGPGFPRHGGKVCPTGRTTCCTRGYWIGCCNGFRYEDMGRRSVQEELGIHHRSNPPSANPFEGLLSRPVPFSAHNIWLSIHRSECAKWKNITYGEPDPLSYCVSSSFP